MANVATISGEGTTLIFGFIAVLVIIIAVVILYQLFKKRTSEYTYKYGIK